jgi:hypothetical protein
VYQIIARYATMAQMRATNPGSVKAVTNVATMAESMMIVATRRTGLNMSLICLPKPRRKPVDSRLTTRPHPKRAGGLATDATHCTLAGRHDPALLRAKTQDSDSYLPAKLPGDPVIRRITPMTEKMTPTT